MTSPQTKPLIRGKGRWAWWSWAADAALMRRQWQRRVYPVVSDHCQQGLPVNRILHRGDRGIDEGPLWQHVPVAADASSGASTDRWRPDSQVGYQEFYLPPCDVLPAQITTHRALN